MHTRIRSNIINAYIHTMNRSDTMDLLSTSHDRRLRIGAEILPTMPVTLAEVTQTRPRAADVLRSIYFSVGPGSGNNEPMHEIADCFSSRNSRYRGKHDSHVEFDATEDICSDHRTSDVLWVDLEDEEYTGEADDCNAGDGLISLTWWSKIRKTHIAPMNS